MPEKFDFPTSEESPVIHELAMIAYLCGYPGTPTLDNAYQIMRVCVSLGPYGWGLAMMLLIMMLSGAQIPFFVVMPVPFAYLGRLTGFCLIDHVRLYQRKIVQFEGFFTSTRTEIGAEKRLDYPDVFGVVISFRNDRGEEEHRCFLIRRTGISNYPYMATIPCDEHCREMVRICKEGADVVPEQERLQIIETLGRPLPKQEKREVAETGVPEPSALEVPEEEIPPEEHPL